MKAMINDRNRGFSLVELLAVITIIVILASGLVVSVGYFSRRAMTSRTQATIRKTELGITSFYEDFGAYPPEYYQSNNALYFRDPNAPGNPFVRGTYRPNYNFNVNTPNYSKYSSAILFYFLVDRFQQGNLDDLPRKSSYVEFKDYEVKNVEGVNAIVDAWGNPILYVAKDLMEGESQDTNGNVEPHHDKNANSFSLYSYGNDGLGLYPDPNVPQFPHEVDYPVQHRMYADNAAMAGAISSKYGGGQTGIDKADRDNITNWER